MVSHCEILFVVSIGIIRAIDANIGCSVYDLPMIFLLTLPTVDCEDLSIT